MRGEDSMERRGPESPPPQPEHSEVDVSIQCIQSSEFVVGKQTNFNGPVTILNCREAKGGSPQSKNKQFCEEKIIIRDKILSQSTEMTAHSVSEKTGKEAVGQSPRSVKLTKSSMVSVLVCLALLTAAVVALTVFLTSPSAAEEPSKNANESLRIYSKRDWRGKPPRSTVEMKLPVPYVVVSHSVTTQCFRLKTCTALIQNMQNYHLSLDFADISYNFLVDSSGNIYEGRGWNRRNVKGGFVNGRNIDVCLIGDYSETSFPTQELLDGFKSLLEFGVQNKKISETYSLIAANSTFSTLSPGKNVYGVIKHWPHFDPDPKSHIKEYDD